MDIITPEEWLQSEEQYLVKLLSNLDMIPLVNVNNLSQFRNRQLVRLKGMIQDMCTPEYYLEKYEVVHKHTKEKLIKCGKYIDQVLEEDCIVNFHSKQNLTNERQSYIVTDIPAVNSWVQALIDKQTPKVQKSQTSNPNLKRPNEPMDTEGCEAASSKKLCTHNSSQNTNPPSVQFNVNLLTNQYSCQVLVYDEKEALKLNDVCEFVGFLSFDFLEEATNVMTGPDPMDIQVSYNIPRIHCIRVAKLHQNIPISCEMIANVDNELEIVRKDLHLLLTQMLLGDKFAAEFLVLHLLSLVYVRSELNALGKFALNLVNVPKLEHINYTGEVYRILELLLPKSRYFAMSLDNLNRIPFTPKKDYQSNRLNTGVLQLSANTHLVMDETKLSNGNLNHNGILNIKAAANLIKQQKVSYNFQYYQLDYECDIPILIMSEGKSLLGTDFIIPIEFDNDNLNTLRETIDAAHHFLNPERLNRIRSYLITARHNCFNISDEVQDIIQNSYVNLRQMDEKINADALHGLLVLARLICLSYGKSTLEEDSWKMALSMDEEKRRRLANLKP